jgi:predicted RNase H-like nuclease (RuvC/YqgF family)
MELWEEAGFTSKEAFDKAEAAKQEAIKQAEEAAAKKIADAKAKEIADAQAEISRLGNENGELKKKIGEKAPPPADPEKETLAEREARFGQLTKQIESSLTDDDWKKLDAELAKLEPAQKKLVMETEEGRHAFLSELVKGQPATTPTLRRQTAQPVKSIEEQIRESVAKLQGRPVPTPQKKGTGFNPDAQTKPKQEPVRRIPSSGSLLDRHDAD